jgi:hypothetical protein
MEMRRSGRFLHTKNEHISGGNFMNLRHILLTYTSAVALAVGSAALAEQSKTPFVSGDEPMNVESSAQIKAPQPSEKAQAKTGEMLKKEAGELLGDVNPAEEADAAQMKAPDPNAKAQEATQKALEKENEESGAVTGKYD